MRKNAFGIADGFIIILLIYVMKQCIGLLCSETLVGIAAMMPGGDTMINRTIIAQVVQTTIIVGLVLIFLLGIRRQTGASIGLKPIRQPKWIGIALLAGVALYFFITVLVGFLATFFPELAQAQEIALVIAKVDSLWEYGAVFFAVSVLAPISEELLFRGYIYHSIRERYGTVFSMMVTSLLFACMHYDLFRLLPLTLIGIFLNVVSVQCDSVFGSMLMHSAWNTMTIVMVLICR